MAVGELVLSTPGLSDSLVPRVVRVSDFVFAVLVTIPSKATCFKNSAKAITVLSKRKGVRRRRRGRMIKGKLVSRFGKIAASINGS